MAFITYILMFGLWLKLLYKFQMCNMIEFLDPSLFTEQKYYKTQGLNTVIKFSHLLWFQDCQMNIYISHLPCDQWHYECK